MLRNGMRLGAYRTGLLGLGALWAGVALTQPSAPTIPPPSRITAATQPNPHALSAADFAAIVSEAKTVPQHASLPNVPPPWRGILLPKTWHTLTRAKLAAMLTMPQFGDIPRPVRQVLIDQAATWDLLDYQRPSDAAKLWERLWSGGFSTYVPDATWSPTALAMAGIFTCFPRAAWATSPIIDAVQASNGWNSPNGGNLRDCLPDMGTPYVHWTASLQMQVAGILTKKFSAELREDGCTRGGPDNCLVIFQALYGLDPHNPELPALLKTMQPWFEHDARANLTTSTDATITTIRAEIIQRLAFITTELPVLLDHPDAWSSGDTERVLAEALQASIQLKQLQLLNYRWYRYDVDRREIIDPWLALTGQHAQQVAPELQDLGRAYAKTQGCGLDYNMLPKLTSAFMDAYLSENLRLGNGDCGLVSQLPLVELIQATPERHKQLLAQLQPLASYLSKWGSLRAQAVGQVASACHAMPPSHQDPFGLCAGVRERDAAKRVATSKAGPFKADSLACPSGVLIKAAQALRIQPGGDDDAACRKDPADTRHAIVAFASLDSNGHDGPGNGTERYDLDIAIIDIDSSEILARRYEANAILSGAVRLNRLWLDTARYDLAPGQRAFGVRTRSDATCEQCEYGITKLRLYLRDGKQLHPLLTTTVAETSNSRGALGIFAGTPVTTTVLCTGRGTHHGLTDIWASSVITNSAVGEDTTHIPCGSTTPDRTLWRYNGKQYVEDASVQ